MAATTPGKKKGAGVGEAGATDVSREQVEEAGGAGIGAPAGGETDDEALARALQVRRAK